MFSISVPKKREDNKFNCPLDPLLDKKGGTSTKRSQLSLVSTVSKVINEYEEEGLRMADVECMVK